MSNRDRPKSSSKPFSFLKTTYNSIIHKGGSSLDPVSTNGSQHKTTNPNSSQATSQGYDSQYTIKNQEDTYKYYYSNIFLDTLIFRVTLQS